MFTTPPYTFSILDIVDLQDTGTIVHLDSTCVNISVDHIYLSDINRLMIDDTISINIRTGIYTTIDGKHQKPTRHPDCNSIIVL